jgi:uncharacterized protein YbjT (DUF2867 family)
MVARQMAEILLTGGKGTTGRMIARELARIGAACRIGTRDPVARGEIAFDWRRPELARDAFDGVKAIYIVAPTDTSDHERLVIPMLEQAVERGVGRFVLLSASSLEAGGPMMGQIHSWLAENTRQWAVLRPSWFMQNLHNQHREAIANEDTVYTATGAGRVGFIDAADIASVAVSALTSQVAWNRDYILTGPEPLSYADVAAALSAAFGRQIKHMALQSDAYARLLVEQGMGEDYARTLAAMDERIAAGSEDRVTTHVYALTGRAPTDFPTFIEANIEKWAPR